MRRIDVFEAKDGSRWDVEADGFTREKLIDDVDRIMAQLVPQPPSFSQGYIQQDPVAVLVVKGALLKLADKDGLLSNTWNIADAAKVTANGIVGRVISECDGPIRRAWDRMCCTDNRGREWEQPYFALNEGTGEDRQVAP